MKNSLFIVLSGTLVSISVMFIAADLLAQDPPDAPSTEQQAPAAPTQEAKDAALEQVGIPETMPNPSSDPAAAAELAQKVEEAIANPEPEKKVEESVPVKLIDYDPEKSFSKLLIPHVADRVGLSEAQRDEINRLMTKRSELLAAAPKEDWNQIASDSEKELKAVLNPQQLERFQRGLVEKTVVLRFSKQKWEDVLRWFATEVGLQIVMNSPPAGTFSYSDKNEYTPKEALDIINGYLQFNGYTLFRYGEMLILHDFKTGSLPLQYLPKITPEDLPNQGKFDYVALTIPLERRDVNAVRQTMQPFQGPYCQVRQMPGNSLMVIDSVNALKEMYAAAMAVHNPDPPKQEGERRRDPPPPAPEWRDYQLNNTKISVVQEQVEIFAPDAKILANPASNEVHFLATPGIHSVIEGLIRRLEEGADKSRNTTVVVYPLDKLFSLSPEKMWVMSRRMRGNFNAFMANAGPGFAEEVVETLKKLAPDADITLNMASRKIIVVADEVDHKKIAETIDMFKIGPTEAEMPEIRFYRFKNPTKKISTAVSTIESIVPGIQIEPNETENNLLVIATAQEHEMVSRAIQDIEANAEDTTKELVIYPLTQRQVSQFTTIYQQLAGTPEMAGVIRIYDGHSNRLTIYAKPQQQLQIRKIIDQITGASYYNQQLQVQPQGLPEPVASQDATPEESAPAETPPAEAAPAETAPAEAAPAEAAPEEAAPEVPTQPGPAELGENAGIYMQVIRMTRYDLSTAYTLLYDSIPGIDVTMDSTSRSLIVTGTHSMVLAAQQIIDELENNINYTLQVVPLNRDFPQEILSALPRIEPQVSVTYDQKNRRLLVAGPQREVKRMQVYIHSVLASTPDEQDSVYYYDSRRDIPNGTIDFIKKAVPQVELQYDAGSRRFTIFGTPTEQLMVSKLITDAENNLPPDEETRYYTFDLKVSDRMIQLLNDAVPKIPEVKRDDYNPSVLIVRAKPALHEKIAEAIEHLKTEFPVDETNIFEVYPVTEEIRSNFEQVRADFENENGKINVLKDTSKNKLTVWALPKQHARLKLLLEQLGQVTDSGKDQAHFYNLKHTDAETLIEVLKDLYDTDLRVTNDAANARLILFGKPDIIKEALETLKSLDDTGADAPKRYYHSYDVQGFYSYDSLGNYYTPVYFVRDISKLVPAAKVSYDYYNHRLIVWGTEEEHKIVEETVSGMTKDNSPAKRVIRYEIRRMSGSRLVQLISQVYPNADPSFDEVSNSIIVRGNVLMLDEIKEFLELVDPENPGELDPVLKFYPVGAEPSDSLISAVKQLIPNAAKVEADVQGKQIVVIARPSEQKVVEDNIKSIVETFTSPEQKMIAYPIYGADLESLKESMSNVYPDAKIEIDERGRRLLIWATLEEHEKISEEVSQINKGSEDEEGNGASLVPKVQTYTAGSMAQILQLAGIIEILAPSAEMFPDPRKPSWQYQFNQPGRATVPKITVIAPTRDQKLIAAMIEQFKQADETERFDFVIYPFGNADATSVETMLRGVLRTAESMSPMSLQREMLGRPQYDYGMYGMRGRETAFFRVDDRTKTAAVFASTEDQERIKSVIEQMAQLGETEAKLFTKIYRIPNPIVLSVYPSLQRMVPTAQVIPLSGTEILAYATESDLKLLDEYISGLENLDAERFQYRSIRFSNDTIYKKVDLANLITANFAPLGGYCYPGAASNQLVLGAPTHLLDRMERYVETLCEDTDEPVTKSYPLKQLTVATVLPILEYICPNSTVIPDHASNSVTVFGTESQHKRVAEFLQEMDVPRTGDMELVTEYHSGLGFPQGSFYYVYGTILQQFPYPEAAVIPQPETLDYIVTATRDVQEKIEALLESVRTNLEGKRARLEIYMLKNISMNRVLPLLQYTVPEAESIMPGKTSNELMVFAPEAVQNQIREILAKAEAVSEEDSNLIAKIYQVKDFHVDTALAIVTREFPMIMRMPLSVDKFMVWGTSLEHERIQKLIAEFQEVCPETVLRKYPLVHVTYPEIISYLLEAYYGQAIFSMTGNGELLADASEADQERIKETLRKLDVPISDKMRPVPIAYDISDIPITSHATIISNIMSIVPEATYLPSVSPGYFVLRAKPEDQKKIAEYIQEVLKEQPWLKLHMERYDLKNILFSQIYPMLAALAPNAQCTQGTRPNQLVVLAKATDQERIAEIINKLNEPGSGDRIPVVYRLKRARIYSVYGALAELYPTVGFVPDYAAKTLYVLATQSEQNDIGKLIGELDREDQEYQGFIKVHNLGNVYFGSITPVIRELYDDDPNFRMVVNSAHQSLIVYGTQEQQKCIEELIQSVKQGGLADRNMTIKAYTTRDYLSYYTLQRMFEEYDRVVPMYRDFSTGKLLVFGTPEEHKIVEDTLEILAPEKTDIAIFDLVYVDPQAAQQVLSMMESDGSYIDIQFDDMANQLYIRATPEKIEEIRQILIKMGEKGLENYKSLTSTLPGKTAGGTAPGAGTFQVEDNGTFRTIRMDEDVKEVLEKVRKNWNRVNSLQVIPSGEGLIQTRENLSGSRENDVPLESTPGDLTPVPDPIAPVTSIPDEEEETEPDTVPLNPTPAVSVPQTPVSAVPVTPTKTDPVPEQAKPAPADSESTTPANPEKTGKTPGTTSVSSAMKTGKRNKASFRMFSSLTFSALMTGTLVADTREDTKTEPAESSESADSLPTFNATKGTNDFPVFFSGDAEKRNGDEGAVEQKIVKTDRFPGKEADRNFCLSVPASRYQEVFQSKPVNDTASTEGTEESSDVQTLSPSPVANELPDQSNATENNIVSPVPGVYVLLNDDGSMTVTSGDPVAMDEFQRQVSAAIQEIQNASVVPEPTSDNRGTGENGGSGDENNPLMTKTSQDEGDGGLSDYDKALLQKQGKNLTYLTKQNLDAARKKIVLEDRNYTVYKVENVSVQVMVGRLQTYMADRINRNRAGASPLIRRGGYGMGGMDGRINISSTGTSTPLTFTPDIAMDTITVRGSKADREATGAMIAVLDKPELFPQPITKPYKIPVRNTSVVRMSQMVYSAFARKLQMPLPGGLYPRIVPNTTASVIEVYAPESLAKEIEEYIQETDKSILDESVRKVHVIELKSINSTLLQRYMQNIQQQKQMNYMMQNPYMNYNPYLYRGL